MTEWCIEIYSEKWLWLLKSLKYNFCQVNDAKAIVMLSDSKDWWLTVTANVRTEINYFIDSSYTAMSRWYSALFVCEFTEWTQNGAFWDETYIY